MVFGLKPEIGYQWSLALYPGVTPSLTNSAAAIHRLMMLDRRILLLLPGLLAGCSLINSFDDVKPASTGAGGTSGSGGSGGGGGGTAGSGGTSNVGGSDGGTVHPAPTKGLIVLGGTDATSGVLSVLEGGSAGDAGTVAGTELKRESLATGAQVAGIAYDGAAGRDDWFIFLASDFPAAPDKVADLEIRYFDDATNSWSLISKKTTLPPPKPGTFAVLNQRLAYLSYTIVGTTPVSSLTLLDTTDLKNVQEITVPTLSALPADAQLIGLLGARGAIGDPTGLGGQLTVIYTTGCMGGFCQLQILPITVGDSVAPSIPKSIDTFLGTPAFASTVIQQRNYYALPQPTGTNLHFVSNDPRSPDVLNSFNAPDFATNLGGLTLDECSSVALWTSVNDDTLVGVTLGANLGANVALGWPGQLVHWDPFSAARVSATAHSGTVIATFNPKLAGTAMTDAGDGGPQGPALSAFTVTSNGTSVSIAPSTRWAAPTDLNTNVMEVRFPVGFACP